MYHGNYTRDEKMCPQGAVFRQYSIESVLSIDARQLVCMPETNTPRTSVPSHVVSYSLTDSR